MYLKVKGAIDRSRPGVDHTTPWPPLSAEQQLEMDQAVVMLREAADQGHMMAQAYCGNVYFCNWGVAKDENLALVYHEKAARQGHSTSQYNTANSYYDGRGCEQSYERAAYWYKKLARQGHAGAICELGSLHYNAQHFPRNYERAVELFRKSAALGDANAISNLAYCHEFGHGVPQNYQEALRLFILVSEKHGHRDAAVAISRIRATIRDGPTQAPRKPKAKKPKPNQPCSCGSGKKYKKCCGAV